jgi:hypothetical protein
VWTWKRVLRYLFYLLLLVFAAVGVYMVRRQDGKGAVLQLCVTSKFSYIILTFLFSLIEQSPEVHAFAKQGQLNGRATLSHMQDFASKQLTKGQGLAGTLNQAATNNIGTAKTKVSEAMTGWS